MANYNYIAEKFFECDKHEEKIRIAQKNLFILMPLSYEKYRSLNDVEISFIDQLIFRFSKLQDSIGEKIFPGILILSGEETKKKTFIDILNRIEELEIVDKEKWLQLRESRNEIAHEYSFNSDEVVIAINKIFTAADDLLNIYHSAKNFCLSKYPFIEKNSLSDLQ